MTVTAGVDVYADLSEADTYFAARLVGDWAAASDGEREAALLRATAFLDGRYRWIGRRADPDQPLGWPRHDATDPEGRTHTGIPVSVKHACAELACIALSQDLAPQAERGGRGIPTSVFMDVTDIVRELGEKSDTVEDFMEKLTARAAPEQDNLPLLMPR